jgi:S1-C subfamily serine protease
MMVLLRLRAIAVFLATVLGVGLATGPVRAADGEGGEKVYQRALLSTVWVLIPVGNGKATTGTGSLINVPRKLVLTNYHVVGEKENAFVFFPVIKREKGKTRVVAERDAYLKGGARVPGKVVARDSKRDLALIQLEALPEGARALPLAQDGPDPGQRLHSIGNPGASDALWVYTSGTVRQVYRKHFHTGSRRGEDGFEVDARVVETQSPVNSGDSGGPVLSDRGELVAVTQGHIPDAQARLVSIFIDVSEVHALLKSKGWARPTATVKETTEKPKEVETTADRTEDAAVIAEHDATRKLKLAKSLAEDGLVEKARVRYQEIIDKFPKTKAAAEARELLAKSGKSN